MRAGPIVFAALSLRSHLGGIQRFNQRAVRVLSEESVGVPLRVHVLGDSQADVVDRLGVRAFEGRRLLFVLKTLLAARQAQLLAIDHVALLPVAALAKFLNPRLPVLMFAHGIEVWGRDEVRPVRFYHPGLMTFAVTRVVCVSRYTATRLQRAFRYPAHRTSVLPNAVDPSRGHPGDVTRNASVVLVVTRLQTSEPYKNVDKVIRAVARLAPSVPDLRLEIIGDGDARPGLMALAEQEGISDRVRFLGRVSDEQLAAAYARANVFVLPSTGEGFGIAYLEAWQHGLPVVGSTEGAAPEVIAHGKDGLLVEAEDVTALAAAIEALVRDPELSRRLGAAGREKASTLYSGEAFRRNCRTIIEELLLRSR